MLARKINTSLSGSVQFSPGRAVSGAQNARKPYEFHSVKFLDFAELHLSYSPQSICARKLLSLTEINELKIIVFVLYYLTVLLKQLFTPVLLASSNPLMSLDLNEMHFYCF